tara:strand:+ start:5737 stop:6639 length:903 start_codon:yes stop_codon:yes gene_type:complete
MAVNQKTDSLITQYVRGLYPQNPDDLHRFLQNEFLRIDTFANQSSETAITTADTAPVNPKRGMTRFAVNPWYPIASITTGDTGLVVYDGSAWQQVGSSSNSSSTLVFTSNAEATYKAKEHTFAHGLGQVPDLVQVELICTTAELDFSVGDIIVATGSHAHASESQNNERGISVMKDATNVSVMVAEDGIGLVVKPRMTPAAITGASSTGQQITVNTSNGSQYNQARVLIAGFQDNTLNGEFTVDSTSSTSFVYTTSGFSSGNLGGTRTVQAIGNSAKIGDTDVNGGLSHWDIKVKAFVFS